MAVSSGGDRARRCSLIVAITIEGERRGFHTTGLIVRQKRNKRGRMRLVEGAPNSDLPVVLVDDSINSARSINKALVAVRDLGLKTEHVFTIAHFQSQMALDWCQLNKLTIHHLVTPEDFDLPFRSVAACKTSFQLVWTFASHRVNYRFAVAKSSPALYGDYLLFGSDSGNFWCLDKQTADSSGGSRPDGRTQKALSLLHWSSTGRCSSDRTSGVLCPSGSADGPPGVDLEMLRVDRLEPLPRERPHLHRARVQLLHQQRRACEVLRQDRQARVASVHEETAARLARLLSTTQRHRPRHKRFNCDSWRTQKRARCGGL